MKIRKMKKMKKMQLLVFTALWSFSVLCTDAAKRQTTSAPILRLSETISRASDRRRLSGQVNQLTVKCVTFNLGHPYHNPDPDDSLRPSELQRMITSLVTAMITKPNGDKKTGPELPDILVFGFQEVRLQNGGSVLGIKKFGKSKAYNGKSFKRVRDVLDDELEGHGFKLEEKASETVNGIASKGIFTFIATKIDRDITVGNIQKETLRYGYLGVLSGNKGAGLIKITVEKNTKPCTISFLNCHNNANSAKKNNNDFDRCVKLSAGSNWRSRHWYTKLGGTYREPAENQIMMGDFNPRLMPDVNNVVNDPFKGKWLRKTEPTKGSRWRNLWSWTGLCKKRSEKTKELKQVQIKKLIYCNEMYNKIFDLGISEAAFVYNSNTPENDFSSDPDNVISLVEKQRDDFLETIRKKTFSFGFGQIQDSLSTKLHAESAESKKGNGFREHTIKFSPSYPFGITTCTGTDDEKYDPDKGDKKKGRVLSYCDRIFYKGTIECKGYNMYNVRGSDHKPVYADFEIDLGDDAT